MFLPPTTPIFVLLVVLQLCVSKVPLHSPSSGTTLTPILDDEFAAWIKGAGDIWGMKGVAVAVTRWDTQKEVWMTETKGYGVADRWSNPVTDETLFAIGSNSKLFTALGIGLLVTNDSVPIDWNTKIKDILPSSLWQLKDPIAQDYADIVDILSHRIGLPRHDLSYSRKDTMKSAMYKLRFLRPSAEFRQTWQYNNQMYFLAAYIIEHLVGEPFSEFMTKNIMLPLWLNSTTYNVTVAKRSGLLAEGFLSTGKSDERGEGQRKIRYKPIPFWSNEYDSELNAGAGGILSNVKDMAVWLQALLLVGKNPANNVTVIPSPVFDRVGQGVSVARLDSYPLVFGLGQARYVYDGHEFYEHDGGTIGHYSTVTRSPQDKLGIAILTNVDDVGPLKEMIKWKLIEKSLGLKESNWKERFPVPEETPTSDAFANTVSQISKPKPPTLPLSLFAGTYFNPAYGTLVLSPYRLPSRCSTQPLPKECDNGVFEMALPSFNRTADTLYLFAAWPRVWSTHVILRHVSENHFEVFPMHYFPAPFPDAPSTDDDSRPFAVVTGQASAEFILAKSPGDDLYHVRGVACNGAWGQGPDVGRPKQEGKDGAEIWFDKVT